MKILIAEDDSTSRIILQSVLEKWSFQVVSTSNGNEAWSALQLPNAPQLAIIDWEMPEMDGVTLCRKLREIDRDAPLYLILLTSRSKSEDIVRGLEAGADDYISKPFDNQELHARVNVGRRMISLQDKLREREKLQGVLEMAGAVCHELNQPLQSVSGYAELLLMDIEKNDLNFNNLMKIKAGIDKIGQLTHKIMKISKYKSKSYIDKVRIIDIDNAS